MTTQDIDTEFLERKFKKRFSQLDTDGDGFVEREDYMSQAQDYLQRYGESSDSDKGRAVIETYERMWAGQAAVSDVNIDGRVSFEEYKSYLLSSEFRDGMLGPSSHPAKDYLFDVCDGDGDGFIGIAEFRARPTISQLTEEESDEIFRSLDTDSDGLLSRADVQQAVRDFFTSSDSQAPGNFFFGRY